MSAQVKKTMRDSVSLELRTTRLNDGMLLFCGLLLVPIWGWGAFGGSFATREDAEGRGGWLFGTLFDLAGPLGIQLFLCGFGFWALCLGIGGAWRLIDRTGTVVADAAGLRFHPSVGPRFIEWASVTNIDWRDNASPPELEIKLNRRFWSPWNWATSPKVRLNAIALGIDPASGHDIARELVRLRGS